MKKPLPSGDRHVTLGPPSGHAVRRPFSTETPLRSGPSYWGQSAADTGRAGRMATNHSAIVERLLSNTVVSLTNEGERMITAADGRRVR